MVSAAKPYFYIVEFAELGLKYAGMRTGNIRLDKHWSEDLLIKYFTSSKVVKRRRDEGHKLTVVEVIEFDSESDLIEYEHKFITSILNQPEWMNLSNGKAMSTELRSKIHKGKKVSNEHKEAFAKNCVGKTPWNKGLVYNEEQKEICRKGGLVRNSDESYTRSSNTLKEKWADPEWRKYMLESRKAKRQSKLDNGGVKW